MKLSRTLLKTMSYASMHMTVAITIAYLLSGSWEVALAIGLVEPCVQTVAFFFHEKAWHQFDRNNPQSDPMKKGPDERAPHQDHHDSIIDSVSPLSHAVDDLLKK